MAVFKQSAFKQSAPKQLLLDVRHLQVQFAVKKEGGWPWEAPAQLTAVDNVSFRVYAGETLGVVGESGCGKSTLARAIIGLLPATAGTILWLGQDLAQLSATARRATRQHMQMIFQDPLAALNPRMTIGQIIAEPLQTFQPQLAKALVMDKVKAVMGKVGLLANMINRYPHEFSGGQCQRIGIARALILEPQLIICDEPVSALDVSIQAQVVNLLQSLKAEMGLSLIFIAHDLSVVKHISDRVLVMYLGHVMELAEAPRLFAHPLHPYTQALLSAVPLPDPQKERNKTVQLLEGEMPSPLHPPSGCVFRTRCPQADAACAQHKPVLSGNDAHAVSCLQVEQELVLTHVEETDV